MGCIIWLLVLLDVIFKLSLQYEDLGLSLSDLKCVHSVLFIKLDKGLFQLNDLLICLYYLCHYGLLCLLIK